MEKVILLHGIFLHHYHLSIMAKFLQKNGYEVLNISYPSRHYPIRELAQLVKQKVKQEFLSKNKIHFVGFSMGGLILRALLAEIAPENLGRLVMIATPNQGSEMADLLCDHKVIKFLYGPALNDLKTSNASQIPKLPESLMDVGIIAGNKQSLSLFKKVFAGENDGKVAVAKTSIDGQKDQIILPFSHTLGPFNPEVHQQTLHFLQKGHFQH